MNIPPLQLNRLAVIKKSKLRYLRGEAPSIIEFLEDEMISVLKLYVDSEFQTDKLIQNVIFDELHDNINRSEQIHSSENKKRFKERTKN